MPQAKDPKPFWMVKSSNGPASVAHDTRELAEAEAERLARLNPGHDFYVLEAVSVTRRRDVETINFDDLIPF